MDNDPYLKFSKDALTLRDELAIDRTLLANERTFLAYLRSGAALLIAGITLIQFGTTTWLVNIGFGCLPLGGLLSLFGLARFAKTLWRIKKTRDKAQPTKTQS